MVTTGLELQLNLFFTSFIIGDHQNKVIQFVMFNHKTRKSQGKLQLKKLGCNKALEVPGIELGLQDESEVKSWTCWFSGLTNE